MLEDSEFEQGLSPPGPRRDKQHNPENAIWVEVVRVQGCLYGPHILLIPT